MVHSRSLWLAYHMYNPRAVQRLLPPGLDLASEPLLCDDDTPSTPKLLFNAYDLSATWMRGHRIDVQTLARHRVHRTLHLVVLDCVTDTMRWDPIDGVRPPNAQCRLERGDNYTLHARQLEHGACFEVRGVPGDAVAPSKPFVVDANRACYFGRAATPFRLTFDERAIARPVRRLTALEVRNDLWAHARRGPPTHAFVHPHPMTFRVHVPGMWYDLW